MKTVLLVPAQLAVILLLSSCSSVSIYGIRGLDGAGTTGFMTERLEVRDIDSLKLRDEVGPIGPVGTHTRKGDTLPGKEVLYDGLRIQVFYLSGFDHPTEALIHIENNGDRSYTVPLISLKERIDVKAEQSISVEARHCRWGRCSTAEFSDSKTDLPKYRRFHHEVLVVGDKYFGSPDRVNRGEISIEIGSGQVMKIVPRFESPHRSKRGTIEFAVVDKESTETQTLTFEFSFHMTRSTGVY